jgi:hypothetical protein
MLPGQQDNKLYCVSCPSSCSTHGCRRGEYPQNNKSHRQIHEIVVRSLFCQCPQRAYLANRPIHKATRPALADEALGLEAYSPDLAGFLFESDSAELQSCVYSCIEFMSHAAHPVTLFGQWAHGELAESAELLKLVCVRRP